MPQWLIRGARITDPSQGLENEPLDLLVRDGAIADFGRSLSADAREIRVDGCLLLPRPRGRARASAGPGPDP